MTTTYNNHFSFSTALKAAPTTAVVRKSSPTLFAPPAEVAKNMDLITAQLRNLKEPQAEKATPVVGTGGEYTVVYNNASLDSVFAAAQLVKALGVAVRDCVQHTYLDNPAPLLAAQHLLVCGTELSQDTLNKLLTNGTTRVTLFAYRDSYSWLGLATANQTKGLFGKWTNATQRYLKLWGERLEIVRQVDEDHGENYSLPAFFANIDNTASALTKRWLDAKGCNLVSPFLDKARVGAMCQSTLSYPLTGEAAALVYEESSSKAQKISEMVSKVIMYHLLAQLRAALISSTPATKLAELKPQTDPAVYMDHWRKVGQMIQRGCSDRMYFVNRRAVSVPTIACTELVHHDVLDYLSTNHENVLTYEDAHGLRIWRVYSKTPGVAKNLIRSFGGKEIWCEGSYLCTFTMGA